MNEPGPGTAFLVLALGLLASGCRPADEAEIAAPLPIQGDPILPLEILPEEEPPGMPGEPAAGGGREHAGTGLPEAPAAAEEKADGEPFREISFDLLASFEYVLPQDMTQPVPGEIEGASELIPEDIHCLDQQSISLKGFMLPLKVEEAKVTEFLIMRDQSMCCFGTIPMINEWVNVRMKDQGVNAIMDQAVTVHGVLHVGEFREGGYLVGIYDMEGSHITGPEAP